MSRARLLANSAVREHIKRHSSFCGSDLSQFPLIFQKLRQILEMTRFYLQNAGKIGALMWWWEPIRWHWHTQCGLLIISPDYHYQFCIQPLILAALISPQSRYFLNPFKKYIKSSSPSLQNGHKPSKSVDLFFKFGYQKLGNWVFKFSS